METLMLIGIIALLLLPGLAISVGGLALLVSAFEKLSRLKK